MKRNLFLLVLASVMCFTLSSCVTTVSAQDELYTTEVYSDAQIEVVIRYGTPFIVDGLVQYYLYNGAYYYPYYYRNYFYFRMYTSPLYVYPSYWRPMPRDYWFRGDRFYKPNRFDRKHYDAHPPRHGDTRFGGAGRGARRPDAGRPNTHSSTIPNVGRHPDSRSVRPNSDRRPDATQKQTRPTQSTTRPNMGGSRSIQTRPSNAAPSTRQSTPAARSGGSFGGARPSAGGSRPSGGGGHFSGRR